MGTDVPSGKRCRFLYVASERIVSSGKFAALRGARAPRGVPQEVAEHPDERKDKDHRNPEHLSAHANVLPAKDARCDVEPDADPRDEGDEREKHGSAELIDAEPESSPGRSSIVVSENYSSNLLEQNTNYDSQHSIDSIPQQIAYHEGPESRRRRRLSHARRALSALSGAPSVHPRRERSRGPTDHSGETSVASVAWIGNCSPGLTRLTLACRSGPPSSSSTVTRSPTCGSSAAVYRKAPSIRYSDAETSKTANDCSSLIIRRLSRDR